MNPLYTPMSAAAQAMYADLVGPARQFDLDRSVADLPGGFTKKSLRNRVYWYYQIKSPDGKPMQIYIGADSPATRALVDGHQATGPRAVGRAHLQRLCRSAIELGCAPIAPTHARILTRLVDHGFFHAGGVLIGTHAFIAYQNQLGVQWSAGTRTQDIDFAHPGKNISIAMPSGITTNTRGAIESLQMGFVPNVAQTTYTKTDEPDLQLDFVTTRGRSSDAPVQLPELNIALQPLKFMEYSLEDTLHGVLITRQGPLVVNLPRPERYALHKLIVYGERSGELRTKAVKDLEQAASLIAYFIDNQPEDMVQAWLDLSQRGKGWVQRFNIGLGALSRRYPELAAQWQRATTRA